MAMDDAIAQAVGGGGASATLRFYAWSRPTLSVGCLQRLRDAADLEACRRLRVDVVRRPTGGRAVLHHREVTYSLSVPLEGVWRRLSVTDSFRLVGAGLVAGLGRLGVEARLESATGGRSERHGDGACFRVHHMPAILVGDRKLLGSAQRRWETVLLQHGSLLLDLDLELQRAVFPSWPARGDGGVVGLGALLGSPPPRCRVEAALREGLASVLGVRFVPDGVTEEERGQADRLARERYGSADWTWNR
jgi:lipoate-protein ligase A